MPLTRKYLKDIAKECGIELPKEMEDSIINEHTSTRDAYAEEKVKPLQEKLTQLESVDVKTSKEYTDLANEFETFKKNVDSEKINSQKKEMLIKTLKENGARETFIERMIKSYDLSTVEIEKDTIKGVDKVITNFKNEWADVFEEETSESAVIQAGKEKNTEIDQFFEGFDE